MATAAASAAAAQPSASVPEVVYVFPPGWQSQYYVPVSADKLDLPPQQTYSSHKAMAWISFFFGFTLCGLAAVILAGLANSVNEVK